MRVLRRIVVREGFNGFETRGHRRLLLRQAAINIVPSYEEATARHSQGMTRDEEMSCSAYLQRGGLTQFSKVIPTIRVVSEKAMTLGAWQRVRNIGSTFEQRIDGCIAYSCRLLTRAVVKC